MPNFLANPPLVEGVKRAKLITRVLFGTDISVLNAEEVLEALAGDPRLYTISADEMYGTTVMRLTVNHGVTKNASTSLQGSVLFVRSSVFHRCSEILGGNAWSLLKRRDC